MRPETSLLVSVVIPCYNQAHFLGEALESVLAQTYPRYEIIVVDDGSTDHTSEVAARYPGVRYIRQPNQGLSAARNAGLQASQGDCLVFLDSDDRLLPTALESGLECLQAHPECAFVFGQCHRIDYDGTPLPSSPGPRLRGDYYLALLPKNFIHMPAMVMYRRAIFDLVRGFDRAVSPAADYELYLRIARSYPVREHPHAVAQYRQHRANMTRNAGLMLKATATVLRAQRKYVRGNKKYEEAYRVGMKNWQAYYGERLFIEVQYQMMKPSEWKQAAKGLWSLLRYYPQGITKHAGNRLSRVALKIRSGFRFSDGQGDQPHGRRRADLNQSTPPAADRVE